MGDLGSLPQERQDCLGGPERPLRAAADDKRIEEGIVERLGVCTEKLNPRVAMVKSAQDGVRTYETGSLNRPRIRRIFV